jgi:hypothetical protein
VLALISGKFLGFISQKTGAARLLFRVPAFAVNCSGATSFHLPGARAMRQQASRPNRHTLKKHNAIQR